MTVHKALRRRGVVMAGRRRKKYQVNETAFKEIDTHVKAQMLGLLYADGSVTVAKGGGSTCVRIELQARDERLLEHMRDILGYTGPLYRKTLDGREYVKLQITRRTMVEDLIRHGCIPSKTFCLTLPSLAPALMGSFLYGYWLGDGWATIAKTSYDYGTRPFNLSIISSTVFCQQVASLLRDTLGVDCRITPHPRSAGISVLQIKSHEGFKRVWAWMTEHKVLDLPRKTAKAHEILSYIRTRQASRETSHGDSAPHPCAPPVAYTTD